MVLARVPADRMRDRGACEFFKRLEPGGTPLWTADIRERGAVFTGPGRCYRSGVSFNAPLQRYLWCQTLAPDANRGPYGLAIHDAPEPWGPWTTVSAAAEWDVGAGETSSFPTKRMSADGTRLHLVFSGDDSSSVREANLIAVGRPAPEPDRR